MTHRWVTIFIAAIISAVASGGVAIAVSYRLWGAGMAEIRERQVEIETAVTMLDKSRIKMDETIINLIDTFKKAEEQLAAARAPKPVQAQWYCTLFFEGGDKGYLDGICEPSKDDCVRVQVEQLSLNKMAGSCVGEPSVFCFSGGGVAGCHPSAPSCEQHRQQMASKHAVVGACEAR